MSNDQAIPVLREGVCLTESPCSSITRKAATQIQSLPLEQDTAISSLRGSFGSRSRRQQLDFGAIHQSDCLRQTELQTLLNLARKNNNTVAPKPAIWIEAEAGVGKSWLLQTFHDKLLSERTTTTTTTTIKVAKWNGKTIRKPIFFSCNVFFD